MEFQTNDFFDAGDVPVRSGVAMLTEIENFIGKLLQQNLRPISLGGDHAVTYPIVKAFARKYRELTILLFDAHSDLYDTYQGNRYSHACPFAPNHGRGFGEASRAARHPHSQPSESRRSVLGSRLWR